MEKITLEKIENDYKEAIRSKFEFERSEGKHSHYLSNPSQALLRDLCWEIFTSNPKSDDLSVYRNFFRTEFNSEENTSTQYTNKFKKVGGFYKGKKEPANISTVELAAILVDFQPRPFNKFKKELAEEDLKLINELRNNNIPEKEVPINIDESIEKEKEISFSNSIEDFTDIDSLPIQKQKIVLNPTPISSQSIVDIPDKPKSNKIRNILIASGLIVLCIILYFAFPEKGCMQWSNDHYELVHCDKPISGNLNDVLPKEDNLLKFKKVIVCDTTTCFKPDGEAIIWYAKTANGIDFFNSHGRHPENKSSLKPVTKYILGRYVYGKGIKCK